MIPPNSLILRRYPFMSDLIRPLGENLSLLEQ